MRKVILSLGALLFLMFIMACASTNLEDLPAPLPMLELEQEIDSTRVPCYVRVVNTSPFDVKVNVIRGDEWYDIGKFEELGWVVLFAYCDVEAVFVLATSADPINKFDNGTRYVGKSRRLVEGATAIVAIW